MSDLLIMREKQQFDFFKPQDDLRKRKGNNNTSRNLDDSSFRKRRQQDDRSDFYASKLYKIKEENSLQGQKENRDHHNRAKREQSPLNTMLSSG